MRPFVWAAERIAEWWARTSWGWLVIIGPILCYSALLVGLQVVGLAADLPSYFREFEPLTSFKSGIDFDLASIAGRVTFALTASLYLLVSAFSVLWAFPRILARTRNPFGGITGIAIAFGASAALYISYLTSDDNLRVAFADDILRIAERQGKIDEIPMTAALFGFTLIDEPVLVSDMLATVHSVVYMFGNAAPWFLIVFAACCASFEPRRLGKETHRQLRERMALLQISVVLAALNLVLSIAYLRAMNVWPQSLLIDSLKSDFMGASTPYTAIWGATGSLMLASALAPAYISLNRHFDKIATQELIGDEDEYVAYEDRLAWRRKHGLLLSSQQALATGLAVIAPLFTSPTLDANAPPDTPNTPRIEQRIK